METIKSVSALIVDGDWIESKDQSPEGIRLIQTGNIGIGTYLDKPNRAKYISEETFERLNCTELNIGDILVSRLPDPIGRACRVPNNIGRAITAVDCTIIRLNPDKCDREYFVQYTQSELYQNRLSQFFAGSTRTRISRKNLEQIEIPLPNIAEQRHIASTLGKVDELIALRKEQLEKLDQLVKSRFIELFGDRWANNLGWPQKPLKDCATFYNGKAHEQVVDENGEYILVTSKCIASDQREYRRTNTLLFPLQSGDICMVMSDVPNGRALAKCMMINEDNRYTLNQRICCLRGYSLHPVFFMHVLNRHEFFLSFNDGDSQTNLRKDDLLSCPIILPPMELQEQFAAFVEQTDKSKLAIQQSLDKLETLKKSLMQEYFG